MSELQASKYQAYPEYKDSGVEWLDEIPSSWQNAPIKYMALSKNSLFLDGNWIESKDISEEGIRYITTGNVGEGTYKEQGIGFVTQETFNKLNCTEVYAGDILISRLNNPIGRACIVPDLNSRVVTSVDNVIFRPDLTYNKRFLVYLFSSKDYFKHTSNLARGATMQRISRGLLGNIRVVFPVKEEQTQIANFLDHETAKIDTLIDKQQQLIKLLKEKRQAVISHAVTKGLNPQAPMKDSGVEWLGEVPAHWKVKKLKHFGRVIGGFAFKSGDFIQQGYPVIKITNVSHLKMSFNEQAYLPEKFAHENAEYIAPPNSLIFAMTRPIIAGGIKVAKMPELEEMPLINQRVGFLRIDDGELTDYILFSSISNSFVAQFENNMTITNQPNISSEGIELVSFPVPPEEELRQIKAYLTNNEKKFTTLVQKGEEQVNLLIERRTALISAAVTGKIDVRNWFKPTETHEGR